MPNANIKRLRLDSLSPTAVGAVWTAVSSCIIYPLIYGKMRAVQPYLFKYAQKSNLRDYCQINILHTAFERIKRSKRRYIRFKHTETIKRHRNAVHLDWERKMTKGKLVEGLPFVRKSSVWIYDSHNRLAGQKSANVLWNYHKNKVKNPYDRETEDQTDETCDNLAFLESGYETANPRRYGNDCQNNAYDVTKTKIVTFFLCHNSPHKNYNIGDTLHKVY